MSTPSAIVLLATGAEEMEVVIVTDVLRRAGIDVTVAGVAGNEVVECSRKINIRPDKSLEQALNFKPFNAVICPGGLGGARNLSASSTVGKLLQEQDERKGILAAICAGPIAFVAHKVGLGKSVTSYPSVATQFSDAYIYSESNVVRDGHLITSRGPGTCFDFALEIVNALMGDKKMKDISSAMLLS